jgi:hypothetical protein
LRASVTGVARDVLAALRAGELEFSHKFYRANVPVSELVMRQQTSFYGSLQVQCRLVGERSREPFNFLAVL